MSESFKVALNATAKKFEVPVRMQCELYGKSVDILLSDLNKEDLQKLIDSLHSDFCQKYNLVKETVNAVEETNFLFNCGDYIVYIKYEKSELWSFKIMKNHKVVLDVAHFTNKSIAIENCFKRLFELQSFLTFNQQERFKEIEEGCLTNNFALLDILGLPYRSHEENVVVCNAIRSAMSYIAKGVK